MEPKKISHTIWQRVNVYGDVPLLETYHEIIKEGGVYSERARSFFVFDVPNTPCCAMATYILSLIRLSINEMGFREPATLKAIATHSANQGLLHFTPKGALQLIHKHVTPAEGERFAFLTKVHEVVTVVTLELDANGNKRIDVRESGKSFSVRGSLYTFIFCV